MKHWDLWLGVGVLSLLFVACEGDSGLYGPGLGPEGTATIAASGDDSEVGTDSISPCVPFTEVELTTGYPGKLAAITIDQGVTEVTGSLDSLASIDREFTSIQFKNIVTNGVQSGSIVGRAFTPEGDIKLITQLPSGLGAQQIQIVGTSCGTIAADTVTVHHLPVDDLLSTENDSLTTTLPSRLGLVQKIVRVAGGLVTFGLGGFQIVGDEEADLDATVVSWPDAVSANAPINSFTLFDADETGERICISTVKGDADSVSLFVLDKNGSVLQTLGTDLSARNAIACSKDAVAVGLLNNIRIFDTEGSMTSMTIDPVVDSTMCGGLVQLHYTLDGKLIALHNNCAHLMVAGAVVDQFALSDDFTYSAVVERFSDRALYLISEGSSKRFQRVSLSENSLTPQKTIDLTSIEGDLVGCDFDSSDKLNCVAGGTHLFRFDPEEENPTVDESFTLSQEVTDFKFGSRVSGSTEIPMLRGITSDRLFTLE